MMMENVNKTQNHRELCFKWTKGTFIVLYILMLMTQVTKSLVDCDGDIEQVYNYPVSIGEFASFAHLNVVEFTVKPHTCSVQWKYAAPVSGSKRCRSMRAKVVINIQYGSFPIFNVTKKTLPKHGYDLQRTKLMSDTFVTNGPWHNIAVQNPLPGRWFASAYVLIETNKVIKGLKPDDCGYQFSINMDTHARRTINEVLPRQPVDVTMPSHVRSDVYKFLTTSNSWRVDVKISNCSVNGTAINGSCPISVYLSSDAPFNNVSAHVSQNCTTVVKETCDLQLFGPSVDQWQYIGIEKREVIDNVAFQIVVELNDCGWPERARFIRSAIATSPASQSKSTNQNDPPREVTNKNGYPENFKKFLEIEGTSESKQNVQLVSNDKTETEVQSYRNISKPKEGSRDRNISNRLDGDSSDKAIVKGNNSKHLTPESREITQENATLKSLPVVTSSKMVLSSELPLTTAVTSAPAVSTRESDIEPSSSTNAVSPPQPPKRHSTPMTDWRARPCGVTIQHLMRYEFPQDEFRTYFYYYGHTFGQSLLIAGEEPFLSRFDLKSPHDIGGELVVSVKLLGVNTSVENVTLHTCVVKHRLPINNSMLRCYGQPSDLVTLDTGRDRTSMKVIYPYPEPGAWFLGLQLSCYVNNGSSAASAECKQPRYKIVPEVEMRPVTGCRNKGYKSSVRNGPYLMSFCDCRGGYQGYLCDDDTYAEPLSTQLRYTLLLTMSNLFFIPSIGVAIWRRFYVEALVYFANMFFSTFYHACDMGPWSIYIYCLAPYHVLSYSDFFCSIMSFWMTLMAVAELPAPLHSLAHMVGAIGLAMGVEWQQHSIMTYVVPFSVGVGVILTSWIIRCVRRRAFYPKRKEWLFIAPGLLIAGGGLTMFLLIETDENYPYTHSVWHMCMAVSIMFLLPRRRRKDDTADNASRDTETSFELNDDFNVTTTSERAALVPADVVGATNCEVFDKINDEL